MLAHLVQPVVVQRRHPLSRGLVGAWLPGINYFGLTKTLDVASFRYHATNNGLSGNQVTRGKYGKALDFNVDYLEVGDIALYDFNATQSFSVVAVFKTDVIDGNTRRIVAKRDGGSNPRQGWVLWQQATTGELVVTIDDGTGTTNGITFAAQPALVVGKWYVGGFVVDRMAEIPDNPYGYLGMLRCYLEGSPVVEEPLTTDGETVVGSLVNSRPLRIGAPSTASPITTQQWDGQIAAVYVYNRVLTASDWSKLFADPYVMFRRDTRRVGSLASTAHIKTLNESLVYGDSAVKSPGMLREEVLKLSDARVLGASRLLSEEIRLSDLKSTEAGKRLVEALALIDNLSSLTGKNLSEQLGIADLLGKNTGKSLVELLSLADSDQLTIGKVLAELLTLGDELVKTPGKVLSEGLSFSDVVQALLNADGVAHTKELTEILLLADGLQKSASKLLAEIMLVADSLVKQPEKPLSEVVGMLDFIGKSPAIVKIEQLIASDSMAKLISLSKLENLALNDELRKLAGITLQDVLKYSDVVSSQFIQIVGLVRMLQILLRFSKLESILIEVAKLDVVSVRKSLLTNIKFT
ncbi:MAG: LamG domain-containing protein [Bacteroidota bacterium]